MRSPALSVALLVCAATAAGQTSGSQPGQIFEFGVSGRALGMGNAQTAITDDASALYYNPAGLGLLECRQAQALHAALYGGASFDSLDYGQNFDRNSGGWGLEVLRLALGGFEGYDASGSPTGSFGYSELGVGGGFAVNDVLLPDLSLGGALKLLDRSLPGVSNRLLGADLGARYGSAESSRLSLGVVVKNAISLAQGATSDRMPTSVTFGAAYRLYEPLQLAADVSSAKTFGVGAEYRLGMAALRAGYTSDGFAFGGGLALRQGLSFDVAILDSPALGISQRVSLGYRFGAYRTKREASMALENLVTARAALERRDYLKADRDLQAAVQADPAVGSRPLIAGGLWQRKAARLREFLAALDLEPRPEDQDELRQPTVAAELAQRAVESLISGDLSDALLLAQVAAGESPRALVFQRLPQAMSKAARRPLVPGDTLSVAAFIQDRRSQANDALSRKRFGAAIAACRQITVVVPDNELAWERLGGAYLAAGRRAPARTAYDRALALDPQNQNLRDLIRERFQSAPGEPPRFFFLPPDRDARP